MRRQSQNDGSQNKQRKKQQHLHLYVNVQGREERERGTLQKKVEKRWIVRLVELKDNVY